MIESAKVAKSDVRKESWLCVVGLGLILVLTSLSVPCRAKEIPKIMVPLEQTLLEARYASPARDGFVIEAERYTIGLDLRNAGRNAVSKIVAFDDEVFTSGHFEIVDATGTTWSSLDAKSPSRINLYRRGPYYNEIHWLDVSFVNNKEEILPVRGEAILYSYAESCRVGIALRAVKPTNIVQVRFVLKPGEDCRNVKVPKECNADPCTAVAGKGKHTLAWFSTTEPFAKFDRDETDRLRIHWPAGEDEASRMELAPGSSKQFDVGFIVLSESDNWNDLRAELEPLEGDHLQLIDGIEFKHDPRRGDYVVSTHNPGGFNYHYYENRNDYRRAHFRVLNENFNRKIYVRHEIATGDKGSVECGVVLDEKNELLPILVQISKNFAGEKEEKFYNPEDTPFSETFFPLFLGAREARELISLQLYQDWGNHPLKQFSSLGAWMDFFHMSTGVTETTCYVPFKYYTGISISDLRAMSGTMWSSQPQHDNVGGHIFMEYQAADIPEKRQSMEYLGTDYRSTGPCWANVILRFISSDERVLTELETFEFPQLDELRNHVRLRVKALKDVPINDWAKDFRIVRIDTYTQGLRYQNVTYIDREENVVTKPIALDDSWTLSGETMTRKAPTAAVWNAPQGNNAFIVEDYRGTLGGEPLKELAVSCQGRADGNTDLMLVPECNAKGLVEGDEFEIDVLILPFGKTGDDFSTALRERERYGLNPVRIEDVRSGEVVSHFPPRIKTENGALEFTLKGGYGTICVLIEGFKNYKGWYLEKHQDNDWVRLIHHNPEVELGIDGEGEQRYIDKEGTYGIVFRIDVDGSPSRFRLTGAGE